MQKVQKIRLTEQEFMGKFLTGKCCGGGVYLVNKTLDHMIKKYEGQTYIGENNAIKVISFDSIEIKERIRHVYFIPSDPDVVF